MRILEDLTSPTYESLPVYEIPEKRKRIPQRNAKNNRISKAKRKATVKAKVKANSRFDIGPDNDSFTDTMKAGRYKGYKCRDVPDNHLDWILSLKFHPDRNTAYLELYYRAIKSPLKVLKETSFMDTKKAEMWEKAREIAYNLTVES